jgi:transposase InsO family protein
VRIHFNIEAQTKETTSDQYAHYKWNWYQFRPNKPRSPHLDGKVERTQKTDWEAFYSTVELNSPDPDEKLREWQDYYNHERPYGSLKNQTPWEKWWELSSRTPFSDEIEARYDNSKIRFRE